MNTLDWFTTIDGWGFSTMRFMLSLLWQSSLLFVATYVLTWMLRRRRATTRHILWVLAIL